MMQIVEQTDKEKIKMYMKQPKKKLVEMLIACNEALQAKSNTPLITYGENFCSNTTGVSSNSNPYSNTWKK